MLKVLVPVDGSEHSQRAMSALGRLGKNVTDLQVVLLNVRERPGYYGDLPPFDFESVEARMKTAQNELLESARVFARTCGLEVVSTEVAEGEVAKEIVRVATQLGVDQIAMGTHGRGAVGGLFLGSIAQRVLHHANVPVLLVK